MIWSPDNFWQSQSIKNLLLLIWLIMYDWDFLITMWSTNGGLRGHIPYYWGTPLIIFWGGHISSVLLWIAVHGHQLAYVKKFSKLVCSGYTWAITLLMTLTLLTMIDGAFPSKESQLLSCKDAMRRQSTWVAMYHRSVSDIQIVHLLAIAYVTCMIN